MSKLYIINDLHELANDIQNLLDEISATAEEQEQEAVDNLISLIK